MAKGQRRSNREAKKPKQPKSEKTAATFLPLVSQRSEAVAGTRGTALLGPRDGAKSAKGRR